MPAGTKVILIISLCIKLKFQVVIGKSIAKMYVTIDSTMLLRTH